ncbi:cupredoxin domain-containing protein [Acidicapsa acidisoli]|uniref:cupredoxin domain-containing protein n=1 Tax=Acidicapsa acidisoli TaxID=1615681 RepID=UPI0021E0BEAC|nr:cupredoxin domain-containing protein [Acidicapsa acidisoli]
MKPKINLSIVFAAMLAAALMLVQPSSAQSAPRRIEVTAKRFDFTPGDITVKKGEAVVLVLTSADVPHGIRFKELGVEVKAGKGKTSEVTFTPSKTGTFVGHCSVFCGSGHGSMKLTLHVVE